MKVLRGNLFNLGLLTTLFLVLILIFPGGAQAKPDHFPIGLIADLTGPYAAVVGPSGPGVVDAVNYINEELNGIDGVPMKVYVRDNKGETSLGLQQYAELAGMTPKMHVLGFWHASTFEAVHQKLVQDKIVGIGGPNIESVYPQANSYGSYNLYPEMIAAGVKVARDLWKESRNPRAAILTWDTSYGRAIVNPEFENFLKDIKVDLVATELFGIRDADVTTHMVRIRAKNPDWIISCIVGGGYLAIVKTAKELGMNITLVANTALEMVAAMKPELFEGSVIGNPARSFFDEQHSGIKKIDEILRKNNRSAKERTIFYTLGFTYSLLVREVVGKAAARVGWDKVDMEAIKYELNRVTDFMPMDGIMRITLTDKRRTPPWILANTIKNGKLVYIGDPKGTFFECPDLRPAQFR